jgi:hypothetical protein
MESHESERGVTMYDVQFGEINTKLDFIQLKISENCNNLTKFMASCKEDDDRIHERIDNIEGKLLDFVPRTAFNERLALIVANQKATDDIPGLKFQMKAMWTILTIMMAGMVTALMGHLLGKI